MDAYTKPLVAGQAYEGEILDETNLDDLISGLGGSVATYTPLAFDNYIEFAHFFHPALQGEQAIKLHPWQEEEGLRICAPGFTKYNALRYLLVAANGSGKDAYCIALLAVWFAACKTRSRVIITSSSHSQLTAQSEAYIRTLAGAVNAKLGGKFFLIKKQHIVCTLTGSEIKLFATDDPGKAEGYHPFPDTPNGELCLIVNEAKSVPDEIYAALCRCTYTHFVLVSSPGQTSGFFFNNAQNAVVYPAKLEVGKWYMRTISAYDCPHISAQKIAAMELEYGVNSPIFRSSILALFTSVNQTVVIQGELVKQRLLLPPPHKYTIRAEVGNIRAGVDFAAGNDECVSYVVRGSVTIGRLAFRLSNNVEACKHLVTFWNSFVPQGLKAQYVFGDDGGLGRVAIDILHASGWPINRTLNNSPPIWRLEYGNRGAELWFMLARLLEQNLLQLPENDPTLYSQLSNRYYRQGNVNGKLVLESKAEARLNGHGSPDRADAYCLAYTGVSPSDFVGFSAENVGLAIEAPIVGNSLEEFAEAFRRDVTYAELHGRIVNARPVNQRPSLAHRPPISHVAEQFTKREYNPFKIINI